MGKWCVVNCDCPNREPLPGSDWWSFSAYQQHQKPPRLAKTSEEWEEQVKGMYACGHRDGAILQFWQGDLLTVGRALELAYKNQPEQFEVFRRLAKYENYVDECLALSPDEAALWQLEIEQLQRYLSGEEFMDWHAQKTFESYLAENDLLYGDVEATLDDGLKLCQASAKTNNPIESCL
jgi:hypothetical protein